MVDLVGDAMAYGSIDRRRSWWGWGWEDHALTDEQCGSYGALMSGLAESPIPAPSVDEIRIREPRVKPPDSLASIFSHQPVDRVGHTYGKAYRDVVRALARNVENPPDLVAFPQSEEDVLGVLDWASESNVAVVPFGGGSSVVGGVEFRDPERPFVSLDMTRLNRVLEIDTVSLAARIQGGVLGPDLENQLRPSGFTLRHFPQSFEFSSLGGWIATRAGGHYATLHTHIDDFVESIRAVTPVGVSESWRLPGSGAGPSPDRLMCGSEGTLGVITEAWMRITRRPAHKRSASVAFTSSADAFGAVRAIAQSGLYPANCRLLDPGEAALSGATERGEWVLVLGVESALHPVDGLLDDVMALAMSFRGTNRSPQQRSDSETDPQRGQTDSAAEAWRSSFLRMPYVRDGMVRMGAIVETFETATTWDRLESLYADVNAEMAQVIQQVTGSPGLLNCRLTHVYTDGAAPYFTVIAAARRGSELAMWDEIKAASMEILHRHRATVTHHHAVGRDHRPGYDRQRPDLFAGALRAVKDSLDPAGILNPGVLIG